MDRRALFLLLILVFALTAVMVKALYIQIVQAEELGAEAEKRQREASIVRPVRGRILDRNGTQLATNLPVKNVIANPRQISKKVETARLLAKHLGKPEEEILAKLESNSGYAILAKMVPVETVDKFKARVTSPAGKKKWTPAEFPGISFENVSKRVYPAGALASQTIGFTNTEGLGIAGLETEYEDVLGGIPGTLDAYKDPRRRILPGGVKVDVPAIPGRDVQLTIDKEIQHMLEKAIARTYRKHKAVRVSALVMEVESGEILALGSVPSYDPNLPAQRKPSLTRNAVLTDRYEPGSTFKTLIVTGALEDGMIRAGQSLYLPSAYHVGGITIHESHGRGGETFNITRIIAESSNVGAATIGRKMGRQSVYSWVKRWGILDDNVVGFPGEVSGFLPAVKNWSDSTIGTVPMGQGIQVTGVGLLRAVAAIGNDGVMMRPRLTRAAGGEVDRTEAGERVISEETATEMRKMLRAVVVKGTGENAEIPGYEVIGKTGTAQKVREGTRGYAKGAFVGSFVGMFPAEDPKIAIIVLVDEPRKNGYYGAVVAAPAFREIGGFAARVMRIPPVDSAAAKEAVKEAAMKAARKAAMKTATGTASSRADGEADD